MVSSTFRSSRLYLRHRPQLFTLEFFYWIIKSEIFILNRPIGYMGNQNSFSQNIDFFSEILYIFAVSIILYLYLLYTLYSLIIRNENVTSMVLLNFPSNKFVQIFYTSILIVSNYSKY